MNEIELSKQAFLSTSGIKVEKVLLPELMEKPGDPCPFMFVKVMSGIELEGYLTATRPLGEFKVEHARAKLLVRTLCDEKGVRLFSDTDSVDLISAKSTVVLDTLADSARAINGLGAKKVEGAAKN